jgi:hypothetical protein
MSLRCRYPLQIQGPPAGINLGSSFADGRCLARAAAIAATSRRRYTLPMRLRSDIFVSALIRRLFGRGDFAAVERKGAEASGAIFIRQRFRDGLETLFGPAPQSFFEEDGPADRLFEIRLERQDADAVRAMLEREKNFDSDLWVVELETDDIGDVVPLADQRRNPL